MSIPLGDELSNYLYLTTSKYEKLKLLWTFARDLVQKNLLYSLILFHYKLSSFQRKNQLLRE